jgi:hypothetical protein
VLLIEFTKLILHPDWATSNKGRLFFLILVIFVFWISGGEAGINVLRNDNVFLSFLLFPAGNVCCFQRAILIKCAANKVCAIRELRSSWSHAWPLDCTTLAEASTDLRSERRLRMSSRFQRAGTRSVTDTEMADVEVLGTNGCASRGRSPKSVIRSSFTLIIGVCKAAFVI